MTEQYRVWLTLCYNPANEVFSDPQREYAQRMGEFKRWVLDREISKDYSSWLTAYKIRLNNPILLAKSAEATERMKIKANKHEADLKAKRDARKANKLNISNWLTGKLKLGV
jgi:hypothetical protein